MEDTGAPFEIPYAEGTDSADAPAMTKPMAERIAELLGEIDPSQITGGAEANLLVVQGTGAAAFKAMSGDITIDKTGKSAIGALKILTGMLADLAVTTGKLDNVAVTEAKIAELAVSAAKLAANAVEEAKIKNGAVSAVKLGGESVETAKLKDLAVTAAKIAEATIIASKIAANAIEAKHIIEGAITETKLADGAVTSRKFKPTTGVVVATEDLELTGAYADVPGAKLEIIPAVASKMLITAVFEGNGMDLIGSLKVDSESESTATARVPRTEGQGTATGTQVYELALPAEKHTIKLRAKVAVGGGTHKCLAAGTRFTYELVSS